MNEIIIDDVVGGLIGLCDVIALHKSDEEVLSAEEAPDFLDGLALGIHLLLGEAQVYQNEQFDIQFVENLPAGIAYLRNPWLTLPSQSPQYALDMLIGFGYHHCRICQVLSSNFMQQTCGQFHHLMIVGEFDARDLKGIANHFLLIAGRHNVVNIRCGRLIARCEK